MLLLCPSSTLTPRPSCCRGITRLLHLFPLLRACFLSWMWPFSLSSSRCLIQLCTHHDHSVTLPGLISDQHRYKGMSPGLRCYCAPIKREELPGSDRAWWLLGADGGRHRMEGLTSRALTQALGGWSDFQPVGTVVRRLCFDQRCQPDRCLYCLKQISRTESTTAAPCPGTISGAWSTQRFEFSKTGIQRKPRGGSHSSPQTWAKKTDIQGRQVRGMQLTQLG